MTLLMVTLSTTHGIPIDLRLSLVAELVANPNWADLDLGGRGPSSVLSLHILDASELNNTQSFAFASAAQHNVRFSISVSQSHLLYASLVHKILWRLLQIFGGWKRFWVPRLLHVDLALGRLLTWAHVAFLGYGL